ncbi:hypothetical protein Bca52824_004274 [Brassica carinata]|uniref:Band 7 domain-containing protein n=1 Tax=Brassica carinata TaxID=52824 RepID=A0A8X7WNU4_BRACI|nr:hypothetical protein Bca52824_004274 [Brassica carinata]
MESATCYCCGEPVVATSYTRKDPGRRYFTCDNIDDGDCHIWKWWDVAVTKEMSDIQRQLRQLKDQGFECDQKLVKLQKTAYELSKKKSGEAINVAAKDWGLECLRYEIRDIMPPNGVRVAMEMQAEAERKKRAQILESEGERQAHINIADGKKSSVILESEAAKMDQVNRASGEAEAILARAQATARGLTMLSQSLKETGGVEAARYNDAASSSAANPANMIAQALTMYKSLVPNGGIQETSAVESSSKAK